MILILFFVLVLNIVAIGLTYYCLTNVEKKDRIIFIGVGVALIYALTSFVYWLSTKDIQIKEVSELGKNLITFLFVPINSILVLPIFAKSYSKYKIGRLALDKLRNRTILLAGLLLIVLIVECSYFKDIQNSVVKLIEKNQAEQIELEEKQKDIINNLSENTVLNSEIVNEISNEISNSISNEISTNIIEDTVSNVLNEIE